MTLTHGACGREFPKFHCGGCCENFSTQSSFDAHRLGPNSKYPWTCVPNYLLTSIGLINVENSWGTMTPEQFAARQERLVSMRTSRWHTEA